MEQTGVMAKSQKVLCGIYALIAAVALFLTWSQTVAYTHGSVMDFLRDFWTDSKATASSRNITADVLMLGAAVAVLMVIEARKYGVRFVWLYIFASFVVAVSVMFPLFLIARERRIAAINAPHITTLDAVLLALLCAGLTALSLWVDFT